MFKKLSENGKILAISTAIFSGSLIIGLVVVCGINKIF